MTNEGEWMHDGESFYRPLGHGIKYSEERLTTDYLNALEESWRLCLDATAIVEGKAEPEEPRMWLDRFAALDARLSSR